MRPRRDDGFNSKVAVSTRQARGDGDRVGGVRRRFGGTRGCVSASTAKHALCRARPGYIRAGPGVTVESLITPITVRVGSVIILRRISDHSPSPTI